MANDSSQIQAIRARYRQSFTQKKTMIDGYLENIMGLKSKSDDQALKQEFDVCHSELHKLAGSFGMYDYQAISAVCREAIIRQIECYDRR